MIQLLDNAKDSIVVSMYIISADIKHKNPVKLLLGDLLEARARGVSVTMYLNTSFYDEAKEKAYPESPAFKELEDVGCVIYYMPSHRTHHDKLIVVDERYVVEGSANWSIAALRRNTESSTLIDSRELARVKLSRLDNVLIDTKPQDKGPYEPTYIENLPENLAIPKDLVLNKIYFPKMVSSSDSRALDLYLLLLAHSQTTGKQEFLVGLTAMGLSLGLPETWTNTAIRRQIIKSLKKLQTRYHLIDVKLSHGRDAEVTLTLIPGEAFLVASDSIISTQSPQLTTRLKFLFMIKALLKDEGEDIDSLSYRALSSRFNVSEDTIKTAFRDFKEYSK
ncbi:MAG: hypothetical protein KKH08_06295 [Candidatus Omnitrophica bacterium]|nr:hypothetical protein [Candidatus Omnitrophota bacterium]